MVCQAGGPGIDPCTWFHPTEEPATVESADLVLVTGGAGFIGSTLVKLLLDLGYRVRVLDNLQTGSTSYLDASYPRLEFMFGDVTRPEDCQRAMRGGVVGVFHLAAAHDQAPAILDANMARICQESNVQGTHNVLQAALASGKVKKVIYAASSTAYGNGAIPNVESQMPDISRSPYASSKYQGEILMKEFNDFYKLSTLSIRLFSVYGARQPTTGPQAGVIGRFMDMLAKGESLLVDGDGEQSRDFLHVQDAARALVMGYQSDVRGMTINAGTGTGFTINQLASMVSTSRATAPGRPHDLRHAIANTCLAKLALKFEAKASFAKAISEQVRLALAGDNGQLRSAKPVVDAEIIIAQGRGEDLSWANDTALPLMRQFIYNKAEFQGPDALPLQMAGEGLPYLFHIIRRYDQLPSVLIFSQGDPLHHVGGMERMACLVRYALQHKPAYIALSNTKLIDRNFSTNKLLRPIANEMLTAMGIPREEPHVVYANGIFATTRAAIHSRPRDWWVLVWELITNSYRYPQFHAKGGWAGGDHLVERYWHAFLDPQKRSEELQEKHSCGLQLKIFEDSDIPPRQQH
ncbi:hypothetical protein N2152v2_002553 [Parachlorella kessleri]